MSDIKDFADQLQHDVVSDMAEAYFGARKDLENMISAFDAMVEEFRPMIERLSQAAATLHCLLLDTKTSHDFYISLDIVPSCIPFSHSSCAMGLKSVPFSLTKRGKYVQSVIRAYDHFQAVSNEYNNGRYYNDPDQSGRKRLTVHYIRLRALAEHINDEIRKVNEDMSTTGILRQVKGMDPEQSQRERIMGDVCLMEGCELDKDMCFTPLDFDALGLPVVQDLPQLMKVKKTITEFSNDLFKTRKHDAVHVLGTLLQN